MFVDLNLKANLSHLINRGTSILVILITSYIAILYQKLNQAGILKEQRYLEALEEMLFITSHQVRKPLANILGLTNILNNDDIVLPAGELKDTHMYLFSSASELDSIIKQLNIFIEETEQQSNTNSIIEPKVVVLTGGKPEKYSKNGVHIKLATQL